MCFSGRKWNKADAQSLLRDSFLCRTSNRINTFILKIHTVYCMQTNLRSTLGAILAHEKGVISL